MKWIVWFLLGLLVGSAHCTTLPLKQLVPAKPVECKRRVVIWKARTVSPGDSCRCGRLRLGLFPDNPQWIQLLRGTRK